MALPDNNTNIMLDLETTSLAANPCIMELAAVNFDFNSGRELSTFSTIISLDSCREAGLHVCRKTMGWIREHIPATLERSENSSVRIETVLKDFANWVRKCHSSKVQESLAQEESERGKMPELILWGNGAFADNRWIESAFHATKLPHLMPWKFYSHMCVRTFVKQAYHLTGVDFVNEVPFKGRKHVALDDCRHQIRYMVLARKAVMPVDTGKLRDPKEILPGEDKKTNETDKEKADGEKRALMDIAKNLEEQIKLLRAMVDNGNANAAVGGINSTEEERAPFKLPKARQKKPLTELFGFKSEAKAVSLSKEAPKPAGLSSFGKEQTRDSALGRKSTSSEFQNPTNSTMEVAKGGLITPETSFTGIETTAGEDKRTESDEELLTSLWGPKEPPNKRRRVPCAVSRQGLLSPETSFKNTAVVDLNPEDFRLTAEDFGLPAKPAADLPTPDTSFSKSG